MTGDSNILQASVIPSADFSICQKISGFSGLPKFKHCLLLQVVQHQNKLYFGLLQLPQFSRLFLDLNKYNANYNLLSLQALFCAANPYNCCIRTWCNNCICTNHVIILVINPFFTCNCWLF